MPIVDLPTSDGSMCRIVTMDESQCRHRSVEQVGDLGPWEPEFACTACGEFFSLAAAKLLYEMQMEET